MSPVRDAAVVVALGVGTGLVVTKFMVDLAIELEKALWDLSVGDTDDDVA